MTFNVFHLTALIRYLRKSATPSRYIYNLQNHDEFQKLDFSAELRARAEEAARNKKFFKMGFSEVNLLDIYKASFSDITHHSLQMLETAEVQNDKSNLYAYPAIVELIKLAHERGKKIVIVSDTYYRTHHRLT